VIPIRVPADLTVTLASERRLTIAPEHPLYRERCPVCDYPLGNAVTVLVFAGIEPGDRKEAGWTTGGAVAVHAVCAGVAETEPQGDRDG
jgi:hypothetical protein